MPKVTEEHLEARRQQILEAAFSCFSRQGFHQTRMADICREAKLSPGAVYRYFRSKEEIIEASCQECQQRQGALVEAAKEGKNTLEVLDQLVDYGFGMLQNPAVQTNTRVNVQLWAEALRNPRVLNALDKDNSGFRDALASVVQHAQTKGEVNPGLDSHAVARVLVSMWYGAVLQKAWEPDADVPSYTTVVKALYRGDFWQKDASSSLKNN